MDWTLLAISNRTHNASNVKPSVMAFSVLLCYLNINENGQLSIFLQDEGSGMLSGRKPQYQGDLQNFSCLEQDQLGAEVRVRDFAARDFFEPEAAGVGPRRPRVSRGVSQEKPLSIWKAKIPQQKPIQNV